MADFYGSIPFTIPAATPAPEQGLDSNTSALLPTPAPAVSAGQKQQMDRGQVLGLQVSLIGACHSFLSSCSRSSQPDTVQELDTHVKNKQTWTSCVSGLPVARPGTCATTRFSCSLSHQCMHVLTQGASRMTSRRFHHILERDSADI